MKSKCTRFLPTLAGILIITGSARSEDSPPAEIEAVKNKDTPVKTELTEDDAEGFFSDAQRRDLGLWFRNPGQAWPAHDDWPVLGNKEDVARAQEALWTLYRDAEKSDPTSKELGPLPPSLAEIKALAKEGKVGITPGSLTLGKHRMPFVALRKETNPVPKTGRALYICMHGGGRNPKAEGPHSWEINSREWQSQVRLAAEVYAGEGIFFVPRMADDRLGRWWHTNVQEAIDAVVQHGLRVWNVDANRVYLMGISEGCYGTQILGPFMADRFGGANAMAGGVGKDVPAENLRNLAFRTDVGEKDTTFNRVGLAREYHARMDTLKEKHGGYINDLNVQEGKGHGVDYKVGPKWMIQHVRNPYPDTVIWTSKRLDHNRRSAFYWLGLSAGEFKGKAQLTATLDKEANGIALTATEGKEATPLKSATLQVLLNDEMLDLSREVVIKNGGKTVFSGIPQRSLETLATTLIERGDPALSFPVKIELPPAP